MPAPELRTREDVTESILETVGEVYETDDPTKEFAVNPTVVQSWERKIAQSNAFLNQISTRGKRTQTGQIISLEGRQPIAKRTLKGRRPTDPTGLNSREFANVPVEKDAVITWDKVDEWGGVADNGNIYTEYRNIITHTNATDILRIGWNGQTHAANTDPEKFDRLQDVHQGWIQWMIENAPDQVLGIQVDAKDALGYTVDPIRVGRDGDGKRGDFLTLDELIYHMRQRMVHRLHRRRGDLRALMGDDLPFHENKKLFAMVEDPSEKNALQKYLAAQVFGRTQPIESDEFPERGVFLTFPKNIERCYQMETMRRKLNEDDHEQKGIVDYNFIREDYIIPLPEAAAIIPPDVIYFWDEGDGEDLEPAWRPAAESWKCAGALRPDSIAAGSGAAEPATP